MIDSNKCEYFITIYKNRQDAEIEKIIRVDGNEVFFKNPRIQHQRTFICCS